MGIRQCVERCEEQGRGLQVHQHYAMPQRRRDGADEPHAAAEVEEGKTSRFCGVREFRGIPRLEPGAC